MAVVTGAGRGIGRVMAEHLAASGATVGLAARTERELNETAEAIRGAGGTAVVCPVDVTDAAAYGAAIERLERDHGPIDLLVSNAGRLNAIGPTWTLEPENFWAEMTVNVLGVFLGCRLVTPRMIERGRGRLVNVVGGGAAKPFDFGNAYGTSKAAVQRFTETLDRELADQATGVMAFALNPGLVRTEMSGTFIEHARGRQWLSRLTRRLEAGDTYPPEASAELVVAIAEGRLDALRGRFVNAEVGAEELARRAAELAEGDRLTLRIVE